VKDDAARADAAEPGEATGTSPLQRALFDNPPAWTEHWDGMPVFRQADVQVRTGDDRRAFLLMLGEAPGRVKSIWFPQVDYQKQSERGAAATVVEPGRFPIYVISKGRWEQTLTASALQKLGIPYSIVVEPQEADAYRRALPAARVLVLPFSNLGQGSIPARNWVWEHAAAAGAARHWILDDNMDGFYRLHSNVKARVIDANPFVPIEQFALRFTNVALAGMNYEFFADRRAAQPPFILNTRIYSCILVNHELPYRWRGRYNEDTDLSLRALKAGWCTVLFNAWLCKKMPTMSMRGGNMDELYQGTGRLTMAESLREQHPDVVKTTIK